VPNEYMLMEQRKHLSVEQGRLAWLLIPGAFHHPEMQLRHPA
jgi:hypothetical protein